MSEPKVVPTACPEQRRKTPLMEKEFEHTRKRLARDKVLPLVQFVVFAYNCSDRSHERKDAYHIDYASAGSDVKVNGGLEASIVAVEHLLKALKEKAS